MRIRTRSPASTPPSPARIKAAIPPGGWFPDQRLSREEALASWTLEGAYAAFEERKKGSLVPGKIADVVMLSADPMTAPGPDILKIRVTMTIAAGRIVYREP